MQHKIYLTTLQKEISLPFYSHDLLANRETGLEKSAFPTQSWSFDEMVDSAMWPDEPSQD